MTIAYVKRILEEYRHELFIKSKDDEVLMDMFKMTMIGAEAFYLYLVKKEQDEKRKA